MATDSGTKILAHVVDLFFPIQNYASDEINMLQNTMHKLFYNLQILPHHFQYTMNQD